MITVELSGQEVIADLRGKPKAVRWAVAKRMAREAQIIARDMKRLYPKATSQLVNSVRADATGEMEYVIGPHMEHAWYVEKGRKAGRMPPVAKIMRWAQTKGLIVRGDRRTAFLIARAIGRRGIEPRPVVTQADNLRAWRAQVERGLAQAAKEAWRG